ncbi:MAG TPA: SDR family NAD(P)-dependent oxidoreductase [Deltaproteobacteria bacterium]|nr:SDR family NAD(P)-dependent oxidoreductase [Deltaproteobacteria bacterium]
MFKDSFIVITGGSSGLGKALAQRFIKCGANLALIARDKNKLSMIREDLSALCTSGQRIEIFPCDVSDYAAIEKTMNTIADTIGLPDILVNSAGILTEGYFEKIPLSTFHEVMDINFFGILNCIKAILPIFRKKREGRIVNISSLAGKIGTFGYTAYCSSKFAVIGLTDVLRAELKPLNIKLHVVCPGEFESPMVDELNTYRTTENRVVAQTVPVLSLDAVADDVIKGIEKERYLIIPGFIARFLEMTSRWFPSISRAIIDYQISRVYRSPQ